LPRARRGRTPPRECLPIHALPAQAREWHRLFSAQPHPAASARNNERRRSWRARGNRQGWEEVKLRRYDVLHSSPRSVSLEMTAPRHYQASLREEPYEVDPATRNPDNARSYFGYSASGDVTAELVYAHSGNPEDYEVLRRNGISVRARSSSFAIQTPTVTGASRH